MTSQYYSANNCGWLNFLRSLIQNISCCARCVSHGALPRLGEQQFRQQPVGPHHPTGRWPHDRRQVATRWPTHGSKRQHLLTSDWRHAQQHWPTRWSGCHGYLRCVGRPAWLQDHSSTRGRSRAGGCHGHVSEGWRRTNARTGGNRRFF